MANRWEINGNGANVSPRAYPEIARRRNDSTEDSGGILNELRSVAEPVKNSFETYIKTFPGRSLLIAATAGLTLGWFIKR